MDTLTSIMNVFKASFESGITAATPAALGLYGSLLAIDATWAMCRAAMDPGANYIRIIVEKTLRYGIFYFFIVNYNTVFHQVIDSLIQIGLTAGGGTLSVGNFADPSWIVTKGFDVVSPIEVFFKDTSKYALDMIGTILLLALTYILIILAFFIMAIQIFITYLEVYIVGALAIVFLGCGVNKHTAFLAEKSIGAVLSFGIKLMTMAFILSVAKPIIDGIATPEKVSNEIYLHLLVGVAAIAFLCWQAPSLAAGLMAGSPSLTAGGVAGGIMAAGAGLTALAGAAGMATKALAAVGGAGAANTAATGAQATIAAANAANSSSAVMNSSLLNTGSGGSFGSYVPDTPNLGGSGGGGSSAGGSGGGGTGGITAESLAAKVQPVDPTVPPTASDGGGMSGDGVQGRAAQESAAASEGRMGSGSMSGGSTGSTASPGSTGGVSTGTATGAATSGAGPKPGFTAEDLAKKVSYVSNAIPPEATPQGGVSVPLQHNDD